MSDYPISLARKMSEGVPVPDKISDVHYPSLYLEWDKSYELPDSGTMTIRFRKASENNSKDRDGKTRQSVSLDVHEILSVKGAKKEDKEEYAGDALDRLKKEVEDEDED